MSIKDLVKACMRKKAELLDQYAFSSEVVMKFIDDNPDIVEELYDNLHRYALYPPAVVDSELCHFCYKYMGSCDGCEFGKAFGFCDDKNGAYLKSMMNTEHSLSHILHEKGYDSYIRDLFGINTPVLKPGDKVKLNELFEYLYVGNGDEGVIMNKHVPNKGYVYVKLDNNDIIYVPKTSLVKI